jgi:hypothetical protein
MIQCSLYNTIDFEFGLAADNKESLLAPIARACELWCTVPKQHISIYVLAILCTWSRCILRFRLNFWCNLPSFFFLDEINGLVERSFPRQVHLWILLRNILRILPRVESLCQNLLDSSLRPPDLLLVSSLLS